MTPTPELLARFERKFIPEPNSGCWLWTGAAGIYGKINLGNGHTGNAHRVAYQLYIGPIPEGKQLDHLCRNPLCVNPAHLEPVSGAENVHRSPIWDGNKKQCDSGHDFSPENTYWYKGKYRRCRECTREWNRASKARKLRYVSS